MRICIGNPNILKITGLEFNPDTEVSLNVVYKCEQGCYKLIVALVTSKPTVEHTFELDGHYLVVNVILSKGRSDGYYMIDDTIYNYLDEEISVDTVALGNIKGIRRELELLFFMFNLKQCYINYCKLLLNYKATNCSNKVDSELVYRRDFLWMTINVIKYYIELGALEEALRVLEEVLSCNGFCSDKDYNIQRKSGCPCNS